MPYTHTHEDIKKTIIASGFSSVTYALLCRMANIFLQHADYLNSNVVKHMFNYSAISLKFIGKKRSTNLFDICGAHKQKKDFFAEVLPVYPIFPERVSQDECIINNLSACCKDRLSTKYVTGVGFLWAVVYGRTVLMRHLLSIGLDPNAYEYFSLKIAIITGNIELLQVLMEHSDLLYQQPDGVKGSKFKTDELWSIMDYVNDDKQKYSIIDSCIRPNIFTKRFRAMELCTKYDNLEIFTLLISKNPHLLEENIHYIVAQGIKYDSPNIVDYLFSSYTSLIISRAESFMTAAKIYRYVKPEFILRLIELGANVQGFRQAAIINSFFCGNLEIIRFFLDDGHRYESDDELLTTVSILSGDIELVKLVFEYKIANITSLYKNRFLFHVSILLGNLEILTMLFQCVQYSPEDLTEFLYTATFGLQTDMVIFLISLGAEPASILSFYEKQVSFDDEDDDEYKRYLYVINNNMSQSFYDVIEEFAAYDLDQKVHDILSKFEYVEIDLGEMEWCAKNIVLYVYDEYKKFLNSNLDSMNMKNMFATSPLRLVF